MLYKSEVTLCTWKVTQQTSLFYRGDVEGCVIFTPLNSNGKWIVSLKPDLYITYSDLEVIKYLLLLARSVFLSFRLQEKLEYKFTMKVLDWYPPAIFRFLLQISIKLFEFSTYQWKYWSSSPVSFKILRDNFYSVYILCCKCCGFECQYLFIYLLLFFFQGGIRQVQYTFCPIVIFLLKSG